MFTHCLCKCFLPRKSAVKKRCCEVEVAPFKPRTPANNSFCKQNSEQDVQFLLSFKVETKLEDISTFLTLEIHNNIIECVCVFL